MSETGAIDNSCQRPHGPELPRFSIRRLELGRANIPDTLTDESFRKGMLRIASSDLTMNGGLCFSSPVPTTVTGLLPVGDPLQPRRATRNSGQHVPASTNHGNNLPDLENSSRTKENRRKSSGSNSTTTKSQRSKSCHPANQQTA